MKTILLSVLSGLLATFIAFSMVKNWEEDKRSEAFENRAQAHTAAVQAQFRNIEKQMEDIRFLIEYDINEEHENLNRPASFMKMIAPLVTHEPALVDIAWALKTDAQNQVRLVYSWSHHTFDEEVTYTLNHHPLQGSIHQDKESHQHEVRLVAPITNQVQDIRDTQKGLLKGTDIAAIITEWDIPTIIEEALQHTPVSAQDITFFSTSKGEKKQQVYFHPSRSRTASETDIHTDITYTTNFDFAGLHWQSTYEAAPKFLRDFPIILAWQILLFGILLTLLLAWHLYYRARYTEKVEETVHQKTKELRQSEAHFKSIIHSLQDIYFKHDLDGTIKIVSPSVRSLGYEPSELIGKNIIDYYINKDNRGELLQRLKESHNGKLYNFEILSQHKDGSKLWLSLNLQYAYDDNGDISGVEGTARDFTEAKEAQERIHDMDRLESLGLLASGIAHDFNNLLTSILGNASIARMEVKGDSPLLPRLDSIEKASESAADLCNQMLAYAGKGKYFIKPLELAQTVNDISQLIQTSLEKNITLEIDSDINTPAINADSAQIQQLVMNLITNAAEAYNGNPGTVSIKAGVCDMATPTLNTCIEGEGLPEGKYVYLEVSDQGCGMSIETQQKIFEPFFTTKFLGRGLGMSATRGILRSHHGAIKVVSKQGEGTTITAYFPASKHKVKGVSPASETTKHGHSGTVLLVDDEKHVQSTVSMMLDELGYEVLIANNGQQGIDIFKEHAGEISIVILDMTMPVMNGKDCFIGIKAIKPDACIILSSGYSEEETTQDFPDGLASFLQKPYTLNRLDATLTQSFEKCTGQETT